MEGICTMSASAVLRIYVSAAVCLAVAEVGDQGDGTGVGEVEERRGRVGGWESMDAKMVGRRFVGCGCLCEQGMRG